MILEMKRRCEQCGVELTGDGQAFICSFECTFCPACASGFQNRCPHCGGELVSRPRRTLSVAGQKHRREVEDPSGIRSGLVWSVSFGVWTFVSLAGSATVYEMYHLVDRSMPFRTVAGMEFSSILTYAPITPFAFAFAMRYPIQRGNWVTRCLLHLMAGVVFTLGHIAFKAATPYGYYDAASHEWTSAIWNSHLHAFRDPWIVLKSMFLVNVVDDISGTYLPIILVAHVISYYRRLREREVRASQLEGQLAKSAPRDIEKPTAAAFFV
jgi:uncharacterized protein